MKQILNCLMVLACLCLLSCEGPQGPAGWDGKDGKDAHFIIVNLEAKASDWQLLSDQDGKNSYYAVSFNLPELTRDIYSSGAVMCYVSYDNAQQPLPSVLHKEDNNGNRWTETIDYEFSLEKLNIFFTASDFANVAPGGYRFRVVLMTHRN